MDTFEYQIDEKTTVKKFLSYHGVSHRLLKKMFDQNKIRVNQRVSQNQTLKPGDQLVMTLPEQGGITPNQGELKVVYEDKNWLVIDKPAGLTSVPGPSRPDDSVLNRVAGYLITQGKIAPQPAIMTRLDRDTTGLVLVAKHVLAQGWLDQLGVNKQVTKRYLALAVGHLPQQSGTFDQPLGMAEDGIHRMVRADGQQALTQYRVLQESAHYSLVELNLVTGRTHQIRVHMAHAGHPLVGDPLYGETIPALQHQALLAYQLTFFDPFTQATHQVELPMPAIFETLLAAD
ncbi:RluA family pseudouridine synthase [Lacticaseibacillus saniviri]|uniref:Pseudouridine synthase n=1 Tax=Lacticaseibacillus saniviri JCM 17471 = DSM 24301 TaxID=1293598 RepID=A0A0R2N061_9LACO|nr:RluA family pseudouridine synthase [Lacticaseibacillus saniviri]KRO17203.1 pseudouridylate synthase, 23S RNA-specific [Lacticaseibacillus saniviri JCM 17471 = DSM 24301]MCG4282151.1 RluA family pseudouridine synthase [Lacticaseibacillus saniviri]